MHIDCAVAIHQHLASSSAPIKAPDMQVNAALLQSQVCLDTLPFNRSGPPCQAYKPCACKGVDLRLPTLNDVRVQIDSSLGRGKSRERLATCNSIHKPEDIPELTTQFHDALLLWYEKARPQTHRSLQEPCLIREAHEEHR